MLHINNLTYRIEGRLLIEDASVSVPYGHKVGIVGRNGTGKTTLLKLITGEIGVDDGTVSWPKNSKVGHVSQEIAATDEKLIDIVLSADLERHALMQEAETAMEPNRIAEIQLRLVDINAHSAHARAAAILSGLGFDETAQHRSASEFSGGWRMRVALAAALFASPEILLLDEPSNYLDLEGTIWLENFLRSYPHTVIMVSHNRELLNTSVNHIIHLSQRKLTLYTGGYDTFEATLRERQRLELKNKKRQDDDRRRLEAFVDRFRAKATKAKQAQSRLKVLAKMKPIAAQIDERVMPFTFPEPSLKLGNPLIRLEEVDVGYDGTPVLTGLDLRIDIEDRIGLLGANGNGKSTLAKLLKGDLAPMSGSKRISKKCKIGYFAQHQIDELNPALSPYDHIAALMADKTEAQKRGKCASIGFGPDKVDTKAGELSGGEKARLLFAMCSFHGPNLLILDEPTNHLDVDSCEALIHALNDFDGAVILISHDRHLLDATVEQLWVVRDGDARPYEHDLDTYLKEHLASHRGVAGGGGRNNQGGSKASRQEERRIAAQKREALAPLRKEIKSYEKQISKLQKDLREIDLTLADQSLYETEPEKAKSLTVERGQIKTEHDALEEKWIALSEELEDAKANSG